MSKILVIVIFNSLLLLACGNDDNGISDRDLIWRSDYTAPELAATFTPIVLKNIVIYANDIIVGDDNLVAYDKDNGEHQWTLQSEKIKNPGFSGVTINDGYNVYIYSHGILNCVTNHGEISWSSQLGGIGGPKSIKLHDEFIYVFGELDNNSSAISVVDKYNGQFSTIVEYKNHEGILVPRFMEIFTISNKTYLTSTVVFVSSDFSSSTDTTFLYDLDSMHLIWKDDISPDRIGMIAMREELMYFTSNDQLLGFDLINKSKLWQVQAEFVLDSPSTFIKNNRIYYGELRPNSGNSINHLVWRSLSNGEIGARSNTDFNHPLHGFAHDDEYMYFAKSGRLIKVSLETLEVVYEYISPDYPANSNAFLDNATTADPETGDIYTANYIAALKFRKVD